MENKQITQLDVDTARAIIVLAEIGDGKLTYEQCGEKIMSMTLNEDGSLKEITVDELSIRLLKLWYTIDQCHGIVVDVKASTNYLRPMEAAAISFFGSGLIVMATHLLRSILTKENKLDSEHLATLTSFYMELNAYVTKLGFSSYRKFKYNLASGERPPTEILRNLPEFYKLVLDASIVNLGIGGFLLAQIIQLHHSEFVDLNTGALFKAFELFNDEELASIVNYIHHINKPIIKTPYLKTLEFLMEGQCGPECRLFHLFFVPYHFGEVERCVKSILAGRIYIPVPRRVIQTSNENDVYSSANWKIFIVALMFFVVLGIRIYFEFK